MGQIIEARRPSKEEAVRKRAGQTLKQKTKGKQTISCVTRKATKQSVKQVSGSSLGTTCHPRRGAVGRSVTVREYVQARPPALRPEKPKTGREMLQVLKANGFVGAWADRDDIRDSVEFARELRRRVWDRNAP